MINFKLFEFAAPPRTGSTWFIHAMAAAGLVTDHKNQVHVPFPDAEQTAIRVSLVRHPCTWLRSYYGEIHPSILHVDCVDTFRKLPSSSFDDFVRKYLRRMPGGVDRMYSGYRADTVLRMEDYPWNVIDLLESVGIPKEKRESCLRLPIVNASGKLPYWKPALRERVLEAERRLLDRYEYH